MLENYRGYMDKINQTGDLGDDFAEDFYKALKEYEKS